MYRKFWTSILAALGMLALILDAQTALRGAASGVEICIYTVVPSLFPFFVLSILLTSSLVGESIPILRPLGRLCGIPKGAESLLLVGILGGYPAGAGCVAEAYRSGTLRKQDAQRMLAFCNLAGPAFLFGIIAGKIDNAWALWGIHIISAILISIILPGKTNASVTLRGGTPQTLSDTLQRSVKIMASVCGWIVLFRVIIAFMERWFLWLLPLPLQIIISGGVELANGCFALSRICDASQRFILSAWMLGFGGLCVFMQTASVACGLPLKIYFWGKVLQGLLSLLLAYFTQFFLFTNTRPTAATFIYCFVIAAIILFVVKFLHKKQKRYSISPLLGV